MKVQTRMAKVKQKSPAKKKLNSPKRDGELYVTKRLLDLTKKELKSDITQVRMEMKAGFTKVDGKISSLSVEVSSLRTDMNLNTARLEAEMKANTARLKAEMKSTTARLEANMKANTARLEANMKANTTRLEAMFAKIVATSEEQNERNKVVLDSYGLVYDKLNNHDERLKKVEKHVLGIEQE